MKGHLHVFASGSGFWNPGNFVNDFEDIFEDTFEDTKLSPNS